MVAWQTQYEYGLIYQPQPKDAKIKVLLFNFYYFMENFFAFVKTAHVFMQQHPVLSFCVGVPIFGLFHSTKARWAEAVASPTLKDKDGNKLQIQGVPKGRFTIVITPNTTNGISQYIALTPEELEIKIEQNTQDRISFYFKGREFHAILETPMNTALLLQRSTYVTLKHRIITNASQAQTPITE